MKGTARIRLGKIRTQEKDGEGKRPYILKHKAKGHKQDGLLSMLDDDKSPAKGIDLRAECRKAKEKIEELSIPLEEGPYADRDGKIEKLAGLIRQRAEENEKGEDSIIEKMIDVFGMGEGLPFEINEYLLRESDMLVVAGDVLAEMERRGINETNGSSVLQVQDLFEGVMLGVAVMRRMKFNAYPSYATVNVSEGEHGYPIISLLNDKGDSPLVTFDITQKLHKPIEAVDLVSDEAVLGITYLFQARNTVRKLTMAMIETMEQENRMLTEKEIESYIQTTADLINESIIRSGVPIFLQKTMGLIEPGETGDILDAIPEMSPERIMLNRTSDMIGIFSMINDAYSQVKLMEIHNNNTKPENVRDIMNNTGIQMGILHDGLKLALGLRYKVFMEHLRIAESYKNSLN